MNLSYTEMENVPEQPQYKNYWTNIEEQNTVTKKRVTYDDILSSLNMVVHNGVLQFANPTPINGLSALQQQQQQQKQQQQTTPVIPQNSYIHNKYFKDYLQQQQENQPQKPMTIAEYIRDHNARVASAKRIAQVKSKKLLFHR